MKKILMVLSAIALNAAASEYNSIIEIYAMYAMGRDGQRNNLPHSWISTGNTAATENKYPRSSEYSANYVAASKQQISKRVSFAQDKSE